MWNWVSAGSTSRGSLRSQSLSRELCISRRVHTDRVSLCTYWKISCWRESGLLRGERRCHLCLHRSRQKRILWLGKESIFGLNSSLPEAIADLMKTFTLLIAAETKVDYCWRWWSWPGQRPLHSVCAAGWIWGRSPLRWLTCDWTDPTSVCWCCPSQCYRISL